MKSKPCIAYVPDYPEHNFCRNGFIQSSMTCAGAHGTVPYCCREEWCGWFYAVSGGKPPDHLVSARPEEPA